MKDIEMMLQQMMKHAFGMPINDGIAELCSTQNIGDGDEQLNEEAKRFYALL